MKKFILIISFILYQIPAYGARFFNEASYQNEWCSKYNGIQEYELNDKTRVDCLTKNYSCEFDFAHKWYEGFAQALWYAYNTHKKPCLILIIEKKNDFKYYDRAKILCKKYNIQLWYMKSPFYETQGKAIKAISNFKK